MAWLDRRIDERVSVAMHVQAMQAQKELVAAFERAKPMSRYARLPNADVYFAGGGGADLLDQVGSK